MKLTAESIQQMPATCEPVVKTVSAKGQEWEISILPDLGYSARSRILQQMEGRKKLFGLKPLELDGRQVQVSESAIHWATQMEVRVVDPALTFNQWIDLSERNGELFLKVVELLLEIERAELAEVDEIKKGGGQTDQA